MWCKTTLSTLLFTLLCLVAQTFAADYSIQVVNESTNSGSSLYVVLQTTNARGRTQNSSCTALRSYGDGSFYVQAKMEANQNPKLTFYTNRTCRAPSLGSISPLESDPGSTDLILTITDLGITQASSPTPITAPGAEAGPADPQNPQNPRNPTTPTTQSKRKVIRFFTPWTNTSAIVYVAGGDSAIMTSVKNYCGWFEARIEPPTGSLQVYFKQTIGYTYVSDAIHENKNPATTGEFLSLDDAAAESDTIWVKANKNGATTVSAKYPGVLGDCPTKTLPVMMFDWLHGTDGDIKRDGTVEGTNGDPANGVSADFGSGGCAHHITGMVEPYLQNGVPVPAANFPENCLATTHIAQWFLPEVITQKNGKPVTNATCRSIQLTLDNDGLWLGQMDKSSPEGGLFLLDDFEYLDDEKTIPNPYFDNISNGRKKHNFGFTMKIQATFEYIPGQYFEFFGDDDVWVFINERLVVDIGGQHAQVSGAVDLDTLGLKEGTNYPFHIFYAERHTSESNFKMKTSIDLKTDASMFYKQLDPASINYDIYQIIREETLACDFSASTTKKDTVIAPSNFTLFGSGAYAEGVAIDSVGTWFGGITIKPDFTGFVIDTAKIKDQRTLPPGTYQLRFSLQKDETQYDEITFVINKYATPPIAYARVDNRNQWTSLGSNVDGTTETLNKESPNQWVNTRYAVNIMFDDGSTFDDMVYVNTSNPLFIACDENGNKINSINLKNGKATFYVKATAPVQDVTILVSSSDEEQKSYWRHLSFMEPPVPQVVFSCIFDRDGDGRGDSVYAKLSKPYGSTLSNNFINMDSIQLEFGEKFPAITELNAKITHNDMDSTLSITSLNQGFGTVPFTGGADKIYSGKITPFWKYTEGGTPTTINLTSDLTDSIGPVITAADISYSDDGSTVLTISFSEGLDCENDSDARYFIYFFKRNNEERHDIVPDIFSNKESKSKWKLIFRASSNDKGNLPVMGDSIKLVPNVHLDLLHRSTHINNPFVRISGEQNVVVTSAPVVTIGESDSSRTIIKSPSTTIPKIVKTEQSLTAKEVAEIYGAQGHYLGDMSISSMVNDEATNIEAAVKNVNAKVVEKEGKTLADLIQEKGIDAVNKQYHLGDEIMNARNSHIFADDDKGFTQVIKDIAEGNSATKAEIKKNLAERTKLEYQTMYFTSLGVFVNSTTGEIACKEARADAPYGGDCLDSNNDGKLFLAWNMKSKEGRLVGTGVYIARLSYKIRIGNRVVVNRTQDFLWGVRHGKTKGFTLDLQ